MFTLGSQGTEENTSDRADLQGVGIKLLDSRHHNKQTAIQTNYLSGQTLIISRSRTAEPQVTRHARGASTQVPRRADR